MPDTRLSDAGVRKNGSTNIGMPDSTLGMPSMLLRPLANECLNVSPAVESESRKGV